jgi:succinyl-diaminopimelate desuccinylase
MNSVTDYIESHRQAFEDDLKALLRIPSVSADSRQRGETRRAAEWVASQFSGLSLATELVETAGHPIVYAESPPVLGKPIALVYGHYDVQPPEPLDEWITPPFEPTQRDGNLYARGATDDKGQMLTHVKSVEAWIKTVGKLPIQVKFLIEGEEEVGSEHLGPFVKANRNKLTCDAIVISDCAQFAPGIPAITYGLRGIAYFELKLRGPRQDLHSGTFGGAVTNPANALTKLLATIRDDDGRVQIPGFYDDVVPLTDAERAEYRALPITDEQFMKSLGVTGLSGETGYTSLERRSARPTFDINGLTSGYQGEGAKTVLPARASAKLSFRLVPNQDPHKIAASLRTFLEKRLPPGIQMELIDHHGAPGVLVPLDSPYMHAAAAAIEAGFGRAPVHVREGGSIPIVTTFSRELGADTHSPNEKFNLNDYHRGTLASAHLWEQLALVSPRK